MVLFEACVDSLAGARAALAAGAGRLEVCSHLELDGLAPDADFLRAACELAGAIPVHAMVRLRGGAFTATAADVPLLEEQIEVARRAGARGVVFGFLDERDAIDLATTRRLVESARPLPVTFHRAFDRVADRERVLEELIALGVERVLTSGGAATAWDGRASLRALLAQSRARIGVIAAGSVRPHNWRALVDATGVAEIHGTVPIDVRRVD